MSAGNNWTPQGCGIRAIDFDRAPKTGHPVFPNDLVVRAEQIDFGIEPVFLAWEIARLAGGTVSAGQQRALVMLILAAQLVSAEGSTRLPLEKGDHLVRALQEFNANADELTAISVLLNQAKSACSSPGNSGLAAVFGTPGDYRPLIIDHGCLYIQKLHVLEARVGKALRELIVRGSLPDCKPEKETATPDLERALTEVFSSQPAGQYGKLELDNEQKEAVRTALSGQITVVSGRPGSGKTSIVASVLRVIARIGDPPLESMALAAPTGKAADRMRQSIANHLATIPGAVDADQKLLEACPPSSTLHRLLGYAPGLERFRHNENNPLAEKLIIVDESSMIGLAMMDHLLRALQPDARIVFLGDADQLPSIEAGAVLRDLCRSKSAHKHGRVVLLRKSYRAREDDSDGRNILDVATSIKRGETPASANAGKALTTRKKVSDLAFQGVEHIQPGDETQKLAFYARWQENLKIALPDLLLRITQDYTAGPSGFDEPTIAKLREIISHYERFRLLCVTRVSAGGSGSEAVNTWFHRRWYDQLQPEIGRPASSTTFHVGEPVMVTRNDYSLRLYNGDSGLVLNVATGGGARQRPSEAMAVFPRGSSFVAFPLSALRGRLDLAWATTVHKAQGSEFEKVAILLPAVNLRPLTRELLYTAVTRARRSVVIVGSKEILESAVKESIKRASGVADTLEL